MFHVCVVQYGGHSHMWLLNTWNVISVTETLNGKVLFIFKYVKFQILSLHLYGYCIGQHSSEALGGHEQSLIDYLSHACLSFTWVSPEKLPNLLEILKGLEGLGMGRVWVEDSCRKSWGSLWATCYEPFPRRRWSHLTSWTAPPKKDPLQESKALGCPLQEAGSLWMLRILAKETKHTKIILKLLGRYTCL